MEVIVLEVAALAMPKSVTFTFPSLEIKIAVDDMIVMRRLDAHGNLDRDTDRLFDGQSGFLLDIFFQGNAFHQFHNDIVDTGLFPDIVDIDDIRMHQARRRLRLDPEFGHKIGVLPEFLF